MASSPSEQLPESMKDMVLTADAKPTLQPALAARGIVLSPFPVLQTYYMWMNMEDPLIGGYSKDKLALRRAIAMSYNSAEDVALLKKGWPWRRRRRCRRMRAATIRPTAALCLTIRCWRRRCWSAMATARAHGFRTQPDGKPLDAGDA
jgi:hypothetical protein